MNPTSLLPVLPLAELPPALALLVKVTLVLAGASLLATLMRRRAAAARHEVWALGLVASLALAPLAVLAPPIPLPLLAGPGAATPPAAAANGPTAVDPLASAPTRADLGPTTSAPAPRGDVVAAPAVLPSMAATTQRPPLPVILAALWALGSAAFAVRCAAGHLGLRRVAREATPLDSGDWPSLLAETRALAGARRPVRLLRSAAVATPLTWGTRRPVVVLPADAGSWPRERRRAALLHELAHVVRRDALVQLAGTAACALYWFHPGAWMALRRLRREGEHACDDRVLASGTPPTEYAAQLLEVARGARALRLGGSALAIGMARPSTLEGRLLAVLDETAPRRSPGRAIRLAAAVAVALALVPFAGLTAVARGALGAERGLRGVAGALVASFGDDSAPGAMANARAAADDPRAVPGCRSEGGDAFGCSLDARPGQRLELDLETGATVTIRGWDEPRVQLLGTLESDDLPATRATMERDADGVRVRSWTTTSRRNHSSSHRFELHVPRRFDVHLDSSGGDLTIEGVEGTFRGVTGGGDLTLSDLRGEAELTTGGGTIRVSDSHLDGKVTTGGGMVTLSRVSGGLRGSSGSGPVMYAEPSAEGGPSGDIDRVRVLRSGNRIEHEDPVADGTGRLHVERAGGDIDLAEAPAGAVVDTGGGDIVVGRAGGSVEASTGGGNIRIGPVAGSVRAGTGAGDVEVTLVDADGEPQTVEVHSGNGRVTIDLPAGFGGEIDLETAYTRNLRPTTINAPWQLERSVSGWSDREGWEGTPRRYVRARGTVGSGRGLLKVKTVNGDIVVRTRG